MFTLCTLNSRESSYSPSFTSICAHDPADSCPLWAPAGQLKSIFNYEDNGIHQYKNEGFSKISGLEPRCESNIDFF